MDVASVIEGEAEVVTLRQTTPGAYNPATRTYPSASVSTSSIAAALVPVRAAEVDGTAILLGDIQAWIPATGDAPAVGDMIERSSGTRYRVVYVAEHRVGGSIEAYEAQLRGVE